VPRPQVSQISTAAYAVSADLARGGAATPTASGACACRGAFRAATPWFECTQGRSRSA